jgi:tetrapyrrole methylase family protein / MazG family protein
MACGIIIPVVCTVYEGQEQTAHIFRGSMPTVKSYQSLADAIEATEVLGIQLASQPITSRLLVSNGRTMSERFAKLISIMAALRAANGCPWDRKQTHESLRPYLLEETYEVLETIDQRDDAKLREELGDVLLQVIFHSQIAAERGTFTIEDVLDTLADKLVRRHPHVFGDSSQIGALTNGEQVLNQWEHIKRAERAAAGGARSALDGLPKTLPALLRAYQTQARAARVGFDWPHNAAGLEQIFGKVEEEVDELKDALAQAGAETAPNRLDGQADIEAELGDILFSLVNLARFLKVNPEEALRRSTNRFIDRVHLVEAQAEDTGKPLTDMTLDEMDALWEEAKRRLEHPTPDTPPHMGDRTT